MTDMTSPGLSLILASGSQGKTAVLANERHFLRFVARHSGECCADLPFEYDRRFAQTRILADKPAHYRPARHRPARHRPAHHRLAHHRQV
ncbi:hypothetical protein MES4922_210331 [Mesorhizobium ventifaucium]|uniref:Uncharacterized protein n=1 Tax=Mesorhizobium ventifaucium TaxID=666020 RepID=A0ABN8JSD3_9HYPH|nr:hypothetical protein MES4922_210331 [Mesorhizobium ventifaucium]